MTTAPPSPEAAVVVGAALVTAFVSLAIGEIFFLGGIIRWAVAPLWERLDQIKKKIDPEE